MKHVTGLLFFLAGVIVILGITTGEIFYPGYSITKNMISTLGASPPPNSIIREPSAAIFDTTMLTAGLLILLGTYGMQTLFRRRVISLSFFFMGMGTCCVGVFPAFHPYAHPASALTAFLAGGIAAVLSYQITEAPFRYLAMLLGGISVVFLGLGTLFPYLIVPVLGIGGTERWVAYPLMLWLVGFGGYLMYAPLAPKKRKS